MADNEENVESTEDTPNTEESIETEGIPEIEMELEVLDSIPVAVDDTLSNVGEAAEAHAVGVAIQNLSNSIDGKNAETLYMDDQDETPTNTIAARIGEINDAIDELDATNVAYSEDTSVKDKLDDIDEAIEGIQDDLYATEIPMSSSDTTKISEKIATMDTNISNAILKTSQTLTTAEQAQARENIGALGSADIANFVSVAEQTLTNDQKAQARENIGALTADDVSGLVSTAEQTLTETQKTQARENIGAASANADTLLDNAFLIGSYTYVLDADIAAGASLTISKTNLGITDPTAYRMAGIIWFDINASTIAVRGIREYTNGNIVVLKNFGTAADGNGKTFSIRILWVKAGLVGSV